ncbi:hypothetical protein CCH79_00009714 [Gambusia affinis]|uniref:Uncharacterized protein n=1 Tax=Gambusia affinis TaxID=33528 RepID=A0A315W3A7_GAMAF|nr:hypothetical protein CCH79_00009714 [Gambusia affinis]
MADVVGVWLRSFKTDREPFTSCSQSRLFSHVNVSLTKGATKAVPSPPSPVQAAGDMNVCYILDGVLILYGIILTVLYCRLRMRPSNKTSSGHLEKQPVGGGIYAGLTSPSTDTYETIKMDKKPITPERVIVVDVNYPHRWAGLIPTGVAAAPTRAGSGEPLRDERTGFC